MDVAETKLRFAASRPSRASAGSPTSPASTRRQEQQRRGAGESDANLKDDTRLLSSGILDSMASLELVAFLEQRFGVEITAFERGIEQLDQVQEIVRVSGEAYCRASDLESPEREKAASRWREAAFRLRRAELRNS